MGMSGCALLLLLLLGGDWEPVKVPAAAAIAASAAADIHFIDEFSSSELQTLVEITIC